MDPDSEEYVQTRSKVHTRSAKRLLDLANSSRGGGIFVKAGQHMCSFKPAIPGEYTDVLGVLQDSVAPRPLWEVQETLRVPITHGAHGLMTLQM